MEADRSVCAASRDDTRRGTVTSTAARGARGAGATMVGQALTMVLQFIGAIILARLLTPDAFGLLAMVTVMMGVGALIRDFGMGTAALQEQTLTQAQSSNLFWVSAALSGGTGALLAIAAPLIARLFGDERLTTLTPVMAIVLLLTGLQTQYQMRLARELRFLGIVVASVTSVFVGILLGALAAVAGWGYWSLAVQQGVAALWMLAALLAITRWVPSLPARGVGSLAHVRHGAHYGLANALGYLADNVDTIVIGIRWGTVPLGNYNRAFQLFMQPVTAVFGPLTRVVVPTVGRSAAEGRDGNAMLLRVQSALVGLSAWMLMATAAVADWMVPLLLGDQWLGVTPLLQILALGGVFKALSQINYWSYVVHKQSRQLLHSNLVTKPLQIVLIVGAVYFGVEWVAWAYVAGRAISWPINLIWLSRTAGQPFGAAFVNGVRILMSAVLAFSAARAVLAFLDLPSVLMILVGVFVASIVYGLVFVITPGGRREARGVLALRHSWR